MRHSVTFSLMLTLALIHAGAAAGQNQPNQPRRGRFTFKQFYKWEQAWFRLKNNCTEPVTLNGAKIVWTEWYSGIKLDWIAIGNDEVWGAQDGLDPDSPDGPFPQPSIVVQ